MCVCVCVCVCVQDVVILHSLFKLKVGNHLPEPDFDHIFVFDIVREKLNRHNKAGAVFIESRHVSVVDSLEHLNLLQLQGTALQRRQIHARRWGLQSVLEKKELRESETWSTFFFSRLGAPKLTFGSRMLCSSSFIEKRSCVACTSKSKGRSSSSHSSDFPSSRRRGPGSRAAEASLRTLADGIDRVSFVEL